MNVRSRPVVELLAVAASAVVAAAGLSACAEDSARVSLYTDSLGAQARPFVEDQLSGVSGVRGATVPGAALCDSLPAIAEDIDDGAPPIAVIQFSGNNVTPCMQVDGEPLEGDALVDKYDSDARFAVDALTGAGVQVFLIGSPPSTVSDHSTRINERFRAIADDYGARGASVRYVDAGSAVSEPGGGYAETLPCLEFETPEMGCDGGRIQVRAPDGVHFCPSLSGEDPECPVWSSGAYRFGSAIAAPLLEALEADRTTTTPAVDDVSSRALR